MIEGSGSIHLTSGSGSGRPKNMWIRRIRIRNTAKNCQILPGTGSGSGSLPGTTKCTHEVLLLLVGACIGAEQYRTVPHSRGKPVPVSCYNKGNLTSCRLRRWRRKRRKIRQEGASGPCRSTQRSSPPWSWRCPPPCSRCRRTGSIWNKGDRWLRVQ